MGALVLGALSAGCASSAPGQAISPISVPNEQATQVSDEEFAPRLHALLLDRERSKARKLELAGVVQYQLARAERLFDKGFVRQAEDAVTGALLLLRHDDAVLSAIRGREHALVDAAHASARLGDAGRSAALYVMALEVTKDEALRDELTRHLQAIETWQEEVTGATSLERLGVRARAALSRSVVDPRAEVYVEARDALIAWMMAALSSSAGDERPNNARERELAIEAYRAMRTGAPAMVALNMRHETPTAAVTALEEANLDRALPPGLIVQLEATGQKNGDRAWLELFRQFEDLRNEETGELSLPRYVTDAASFGAAIGLYRSAPGEMENAMPLAMILTEFGMPEVASTLLAQNLSAQTRDEALAWSLTLVLRGLLEMSETDQLAAARRSYQEAAPLLQRGESLPLKGPHPARASQLMAALEIRHAEVERAQALLLDSIRLQPSASAYHRLSRLELQMGRADVAWESSMKALELAAEEGDLLLESRAALEGFGIARQQSRAQRAKESLDRALARIVVLQKMELPTMSKAAVERQLASVLQYYEADHALRSAYRRALDASRQDPVELEITLTEMARTALARGDKRLSEQALNAALDLGLPAENAIYIALWHQLTLDRSQSRPDGLSRQIFERAGRSEGWIGTLRSFGLGEIEATQLPELAEGPVEGTEADFYLALSKAEKQKEALRRVAESPAVDLVEVAIARDLARDDSEAELFAVPDDLDLP